jgi:hypothetical protein
MPRPGEVLDRPAQNGCRGVSALVWVLLDVSVAGVVVDYAVQVDVADSVAFFGPGLVPHPGDGMPRAVEARQAGDVDVNRAPGADHS